MNKLGCINTLVINDSSPNVTFVQSEQKEAGSKAVASVDTDESFSLAW